MSRGERWKDWEWAVEPAQWQGPVLRTFIMVADVYLPPNATRAALALMSPAQVDPGLPSMTPSGSWWLRQEKKEDMRKEEWVPTWRTLLPFVKEHVKNNVSSEYPLKQFETHVARATCV